jgi:predicted ATPase
MRAWGACDSRFEPGCPDFLIQMKKITPNWYVITGGPSSGKTTVINELAKLGYLTIPEAARVYFNQETAKGKSLDEIRGDEAEFQRKVLKMKIKIENDLPKNKIIFLDRAIPDSIAYYQVCGLNPKEVTQLCQKKQYQKIFFLEQLPVENDYARIENAETIKKLNRLLKEEYQNLGYKVIDIPPMSVEKRVQKILAEMNKN